MCLYLEFLLDLLRIFLEKKRGKNIKCDKISHCKSRFVYNIFVKYFYRSARITARISTIYIFTFYNQSVCIKIKTKNASECVYKLDRECVYARNLTHFASREKENRIKHQSNWLLMSVVHRIGIRQSRSKCNHILTINNLVDWMQLHISVYAVGG